MLKSLKCKIKQKNAIKQVIIRIKNYFIFENEYTFKNQYVNKKIQ